MTISELLAEIGDENISFQNLTRTLSSVNNGKKESKITFITSRDMGLELANSVALGHKPEHTAYIVWMPTAKLDAVLAKAVEDER